MLIYIVKAVINMQKHDKLRIWELSLLIALCVSLCVGTWAQARQSDLRDSLVRLHVIAVSDDACEQEVKLRVRDEVLSFLSPKLRNAENSVEAKATISENLTGIRAAAEKAAGGRSVTVSLSEEFYPTRHYDTFSLPAGRYDSLRVTLGSGQGHNWWCVVFPPLCTSAAEYGKAMEALDEDEYRLITEADGFKYKFRIVELWGELMRRIKS